ncbi:MAG: HD domain-containing protein [Ardenticatenaceae bacterium]|nr:HD domain-containing protein [Ardenticatenaceae bacterium]MCB9443733.1 HD domain-containing protein [Ardenticatenaceae bacterium]
MKSIFTSHLQVGDELDNEPFLLQGVARRTTKDGRPYLLFLLQDKKGQVNAVFWSVPDYVDGWAKDGAVALVTGRVVSYKDSLQVTVTDLNPAANPDMSDFLSSSRRPQEEMVKELEQQIKSLQEPWRTLCSHLLLNEDFLPKFSNSPAARSMHHAYIGGLLEHTLSMATMADYMSEHYSYVNRSLLIAGALLHDMGKVHEYSIEGEFAFSDDGRLVGHIVRAVTMVETAAAELVTLTPEQTREIVHIIVSHHGTLEYGSPVTPKTLEAILLHQIDLLDSRVQGYFDYLESDASDGDWTSKSSPMFKSELRRPPDMNG